jgi:isochorismate synthase
MPKLLEKALEKRWELQRPFVFFSHPNERFVHHYWQDDLQLQKTPIQEVNGFVLAPFELKNEQPFISDAQHRQYNRPEVKNIPDNLALPKETHDKESFLALIDKTRKQIEKGTFQKVVLSRPIHLPDASGHPVAMFLAMLSYFPKAMVYLWHHPQVGTWLGASPEQFLKIEGDQLYTMALAGTLPATSAPQWSSKEIEEQELVVEDIVQILQKQFPKKAITLSPPYNRTAGNLVHLCTDITVVATEFSLNQLTKALHPTPAVGGVPSEKAKRYILDNEGYSRGFYSGFFGPVGKHSANLYVNLRCMQWSTTNTTLFVGGGITRKSEPEMEWEETQRKASILYNLSLGSL